MKIAILTSGILPVPAVKGGAVENHIDIYLKYNDEHRLHDITVFSVDDAEARRHPALQSAVNHYVYIKTNRLWDKMRKFITSHFSPLTSHFSPLTSHLSPLTSHLSYYHPSIDYFFHRAWQQLKKQHYDLILLDNRPGYAVHIDVPEHTKLALYLHNDLLNNETKAYQDIYDKASRILTVSDYISSRVRTINPSDTKCIRVHNGSDITLFHPGKPSKITRSQLHIADDDFILYFSGRIIPEKGVLELIKAVRLLDHPHIKLLIIGSSFYGNVKADSPYIQALKAEAKAIQERIIFTGYIPYTELPNYLWISDVAVVPSLWEEPFGNTVVEAMAAGVPLITTRSGGIPEICEGVATIVERDDLVNSLAQSILDLYEHPEKRRQLSAAALERSRLFDKDTYARNFFEALTA